MNTKDVIDWVSEADNEMCVKTAASFLFLLVKSFVFDDKCDENVAYGYSQ